MAVSSSVKNEIAPVAKPSGRRGVLGDKIFYYSTLAFAASVLLICFLIFVQLYIGARPAIHQFGWRFLTTQDWDPGTDHYSALPFIYGTLVSSLLALFIAVPIGLGTAVFLSELAPKWLRAPLSFLVELLAAVPSVVYGLWGIFVMIPALKPIEKWVGDVTTGSPLCRHLGIDQFFSGPPLGFNMLAAALILAIMVLPFITAVSREVILAVPPTQREAAFGLGATHWEAIKGPILRYSRAGIMGAVILGLARALGETMAVTMVIGNSNNPINVSVLSSASTLASVLASQFAEALQDLEVASLLEIALILFGITIVVNSIARLLIWSMARTVKGAVRL